jgi:hypothetical protein
VFLGDSLQFRGELADVDNIGSKGKNEGGQGTRLLSRMHIHAVEVVVQFGMVAQHGLVEDR